MYLIDFFVRVLSTFFQLITDNLPTVHVGEARRSSTIYTFGSENLTQEEIDLIRTSWDPVEKNLGAVGKLLFTIMFEKFPQYEEMFKKFQEKGKSLLDSEKFLSHAQKNVMITMCKLVENLDNDEERKTLLSSVGARHFKRNVRGIHFENIVEIIMETLRRGLGEAFTDDLSKTWLKMLMINMKIMGDACETAAT